MNPNACPERLNLRSSAGFWAIGALFLLICLAAPRYPQPASYHQFAQDHELRGVPIPNFWNVISNAPFLAVAALAFFHSRGSSRTSTATARTFLLGVFLTGIGSAYYHWDPSNETLFWDRLPMTIAFSAATAGLIQRRVDPVLGRKLLWPLLALSAATVLYWRWSESVGRGNLVPYGIVQFGTMALVLGVLLVKREGTRADQMLWLALVFYTAAKLLEGFDSQIGAVLHVMGGHPIKHVAAAISCWFLWLGLFRGQERE